jgi:two-component system chemotaxis response regulator CheB
VLQPGHICVAPTDRHLLIDESKVWVVRGPRENRWRPAIDTLFRSAAVSHRSRVIGVILTGFLDDGTAGLSAIKRCGGICIVQDPDDAAFPDMPRTALANVAVDYCVPLAEIGGLITRLVAKQSVAAPAIPRDLLTEARIARSALSQIATVDSIGEKTPLTCPDCGGVLWELNGDGIPRFRCHTGHAYTSDQLLQAQSSRIEETLWRALRMFEERKNLLKTMSAGGKVDSTSAEERILQAEEDIRRLRGILQAGQHG